MEGNFYEKDQIVGLSRFIKAAKYRGYDYDEVLEAWNDAYEMKCFRKRVHFLSQPAIFSTSGHKRYRRLEDSMSLAERLKLATSSMDPHDIKLCYPAFLQTAMEVYGLTMDSFGKEVQK